MLHAAITAGLVVLGAAVAVLVGGVMLWIDARLMPAVTALCGVLLGMGAQRYRRVLR